MTEQAQRKIDVIPYADAQPAGLPPRTNWKVITGDGQVITDWNTIVDERYGTFEHVVVEYEGGKPFDKIDANYTPAVFVVPFRINPDKGNRTEFFIPSERRPLIKDEDGLRGNQTLRNIPQGLPKEGESFEDAAFRETYEETGLTPKTPLIFLRSFYKDAANSSTPHLLFLAEVPYGNQTYKQALEDTEVISASESDWFSVEEILALELQAAETLAGIFIATGFLGLWNNPNNSDL